MNRIVTPPRNLDTERERENEDENQEPSLQNPTWDFLFSNFTKTQLQKHCRNIGLNSVWKRKDELVDMIMNKHQSTSKKGTLNSQSNHMVDALEKVYLELENIKEKLELKDMEILELNELLKTSNVTINRLNDRLTALEDQISDSRVPPRPEPNPVEVERTLLIGDENLSYIRPSDLGKECSVKTLKETTMDLTRCWIKEKLNWIPSKCVIYCGKNDLMETENYNNILDDLGSLVSELRNKNENVELFICELIPDLNDGLDEKINTYNEKLHQWSAANGIKSLKTNIYFKWGTDDVDNVCYDVHNMSEATLNRYGVIRLISAINKQCQHLKLSNNFIASKRNIKVYEQNLKNIEEDSYENYHRNTQQELQRQNTQLQGRSANSYKDVNRGNGVPARGLRNRRTP